MTFASANAPIGQGRWNTAAARCQVRPSHPEAFAIGVPPDIYAFLAALLATVACASSAMALTITGRAEVIDSDLFILDGYRVFLFGAESVEDQQPCLIGMREWECYPAAVRQLQTILDEGVVT